jgi:hypothetical protein
LFIIKKLVFGPSDFELTSCTVQKIKNQAILKPNKSMYYLEKDRAAGMLMGESREWPRALTGFDLVLKPALLHMKEGGAVTSCQRLVVASNIIATVGGQMSLSIKFSANVC